MATTTPNFGWPVPTSTDYVKDGATAIEALGDAIDTTVATLGSDLTLIKTQTIGTAVSTVNVTGAFSADYDVYKIYVNGGTCTLQGWGYLQLGASTANYSFGAWEKRYSGSTTDYTSYDGGANFGRCWSPCTNYLDLNIELKNPYLAKYTLMNFVMQGPNDGNFNGGGQHRVATSYTDFTIGIESGTITGGTIYVYGLRNS